MIAGIRSHFVDDLVEHALIRYGMGDSIRSIANDLGVSENSIKRWVKVATEHGYYGDSR